MTNIRDLENLASETDVAAIEGVISNQPRTTTGLFNLAQVAGSYPLLTAAGDVLCEIKEAYVKTAATGLTSVTLSTTHTSSKSVVASTLLAALTLDAILTLALSTFVLPSGKALQGTIVGTGTAGLIYLVVSWTPLSPGATLA